MSPGNRQLGSVDASLVKFRRLALQHEVGKLAHVHAWGILDDDGEMVGVLAVVACKLCPAARSGQDPDELVTWLLAHHADHGVGDG